MNGTSVLLEIGLCVMTYLTVLAIEFAPVLFEGLKWQKLAHLILYNFSEGRVTDHRIDLKVYQLSRVMEGELELLVGPLQEADQARRLSGED
jgi:hypothetical protein